MKGNSTAATEIDNGFTIEDKIDLTTNPTLTRDQKKYDPEDKDEKKSVPPQAIGHDAMTLGRLAGFLWDTDTSIVISPLVLEDSLDSKQHTWLRKCLAAGHARRPQTGHYQIIALCQQQSGWYAWIFQFDAHQILISAVYLHPLMPTQWDEAWTQLLPKLAKVKVQTLSLPVEQLAPPDSGPWVLGMLELTLKKGSIPILTLEIAPLRRKYSSKLVQAPFVPLGVLASGLAQDLMTFKLLQKQYANLPSSQAARYDENEQKIRIKSATELDQRQQKLIRQRLAEMEEAKAAHQTVNFSAAIQHWLAILAIEERVKRVPDSQIVITLNNIGTNYVELDEHDKALYYYQQALRITEMIAGTHQPEAARTRSHIGSVHAKLGQHRTAMTFYQEALRIQEAKLDPLHSDTAETLQHIAALYSALSDHKQSWEYYQRALDIFNKIYPPDHLKLANIYCNIGMLHFGQHDYAQALADYQRALAIEEKQLSGDDLQLAQTLNGIAGIYVIQHRFDEAEPLFDRALQTQESKLGHNHTDLAATYHNIGNFYQLQADYAHALSYYERALNIEKAHFGSPHPSVASALYNIGFVYVDQCNYVQALTYLKQALHIREAVFGVEHPTVLHSLQVIAETYTHLADHDQAGPYWERIEKIQQTLTGTYTLDASESLFTQGHLHEHQADYKQALFCYTQALTQQRITFGASHPIVANTLQQIATVYLAQSSYAKAMEYALQALQIYDAYFPTEHPKTARALTCVGNILFRQAIYPNALVCYQDALAIQEKKLDTHHAEVALTLHNMAIVYSQQEDHAKALEYYERALPIARTALGEEHPLVATILQSIAAVYAHKKDYDTAFRHMRTALIIHTRKLGERHPQTATTLMNLAITYEKQGDYVQALKYHRQACDIFSAILGPLAPETCLSQRNIALVLEQQALYVTTETPDTRLKNIKQASEVLKSLYEQHEQLFQQQPTLTNNLYDLTEFDHMVKDLARLYRGQGQHDLAYGLYLQEAYRWQKPFPGLALRYVNKARREMPFFSSKLADRATLARLEAALLAQQQRWPRALQALTTIPQNLLTTDDEQHGKTWNEAWEKQCRELLDEDLVGEWQRCLDSIYEIELRLFKDLSQGYRLSETVKNRVTEVIIKLRNLLDQSTGRFTGECIYSINGEQRQEMGYFPFMPSEKALHKKWRKEKLIQSDYLPLSILKKHLEFNPNEFNFLYFWQSLEEAKIIKRIDNKIGELTTVFDPISPLPPTLAKRFAHLPTLSLRLQQKKPGDRVTRAELDPASFVKFAPPSWSKIEKALVDDKFLMVVRESKDAPILGYQFGSAWQPGSPGFRLTLLPPLDIFTDLISAGLQAATQQWQSVRTLDQDPALRSGYDILLKHQAFRYYDPKPNQPMSTDSKSALWERSWLDTLIAIGNDSKHIRLTPQGTQARLAQKQGLIHSRQMHIVIAYIEPEGVIYSWTFVPLLWDIKPMARRLQLSKEIYRALRETKQLKNIDGLMVPDPAATAAFVDAVRIKSDNHTLQTARAAYARQIKQSLSKVVGLTPQHLQQITNNLLRRAAQRQQLSFIPDRELEIETLLQHSLAGVLEILQTLGSLRRQDRRQRQVSEVKWRTPPSALVQAAIDSTSTPPTTRKKRSSFEKQSTLTLAESHAYWAMVEQDAESAYNAGDFVAAAVSYQRAVQYLPEWLHGLCYQRLNWLMGSSLQAPGERTLALMAHADYFQQQSLRRLSHQYWKKAADSVQSQFNKPLQAEYQKALKIDQDWQTSTDWDLRSQLEHTMESVHLLRERLWLATAPSASLLCRFEIENRLGELVVKLRHLLDQALSRWINRKLCLSSGQAFAQHKYPSRGSKFSLARWALMNGLIKGMRDFQKEEEISEIEAKTTWAQLEQQYPYPSVWSTLVASQPFSSQITSTDGTSVSWLEALSSLANASKHTGLPQINWSLLTAKSSLNQFETLCQINYISTKLAEWSFTPMLDLATSAEFYYGLNIKNFLTGSPGYKQLTQPDCIALAEAVNAHKPQEEIVALRTKLEEKLQKEFKSPLGSVKSEALDKIMTILQVQAHITLRHDVALYAPPQSVEIFTLLAQSIESINAIFAAIYGDLPKEEDRMEPALRKLLLSPAPRETSLDAEEKKTITTIPPSTSSSSFSASSSSIVSTAQNRYRLRGSHSRFTGALTSTDSTKHKIIRPNK